MVVESFFLEFYHTSLNSAPYIAASTGICSHIVQLMTPFRYDITLY